MLKDVLPANVYFALMSSNLQSELNEIRLRVGKPISVLCNSKHYFLSEQGLISGANQAIIATNEMLVDIIFKASEYSIYSVNDQLKQGFLMVKGGIRIGICGEVVCDDNIKTIKNFSSLCIRIPHLIKNVSLPIFGQILSGGILNSVLIISPPGAGKTTMLRDLIYQFSNHGYPYNIFIADERGEITAGVDGFNLGYFHDSICFLNKRLAMIMGIRAMSPDIIVTDELGDLNDFEAIQYAINCGVKVIATIHANSLDEIKNKPEMSKILEQKLFGRYVVLSKSCGAGTIEGIYRENFTKIYGGTI